MATTYFFITPPVKNTAWEFWCALTSQADTDVFQTSVTLAAGDVTVSTDGGAFSNIDTLPTEIGTTGCLNVDLSASEMNGDKFVIVLFNDAAGAEWQDAMFLIPIQQAVTVSDVTTAQVNTECDTALVDYDPPTKAELDAGLAGLNDPTAAAVALAVGQRAIPDSYAADGAQPTIEQAILMIKQFLEERAVSGTTVVVRKPDGATTAMTFTLNDPTDPTSITRTG